MPKFEIWRVGKVGNRSTHPSFTLQPGAGFSRPGRFPLALSAFSSEGADQFFALEFTHQVDRLVALEDARRAQLGGCELAILEPSRAGVLRLHRSGQLLALSGQNESSGCALPLHHKRNVPLSIDGT